MTTELILKIRKDPKMHDFLINHSYWYKELNRNPNNYKDFLSAFKNDKRNQNFAKVNNVVDTLDTVNMIFKTLN